MFTLDQAGRRRREVEILPAPPRLRPWIEHVVVDDRPAGERGPWRIVPDPCAHVIVSFGMPDLDDASAPGARPAPGRRTRSVSASRDRSRPPGPLRSARIVGARSRWIDADATPRGMTVGLRFRPGGLAPLLRIRGDRLTDRGADLADLLGRPGREAVERMAVAGSVAEVLAVLTSTMESIAARRAGPDWRVGALARALAAGGPGRGPGALAEATGMAPRTVRAVTAGEIGLSPSRWVRIRRLFGALVASGSTPAPVWRRVAGRAGYHDPSHLTREFRALLGETPTQWSRRARR